MSHPGPRAPMASGGRRWLAPNLSPKPGLARHAVRPADAAGAGIHWLRTLQAKGSQRLAPVHLRHRPVSPRTPPLHLIALDTSGSMRRGGRLAWAKGYAARLIEQAARAGDHVALLSFGGQGVQLLLPPGPARAAGRERVRPVGGGGGTPLSACLNEADRLLRKTQRQRGAAGGDCLWLLTDGRTLEQPMAPGSAGHIVVVDFDDPLRPLGRCAAWAERWQAEHRLPA
ncbi:MAG: VWA domain-containing protein [Hydrogenophaga sp.]|uniref:vWA domain-containing protein n=1 Tax=Hydrogenophaga sp. TaxID=1904254 RepID=UPI0025B9CC78|nr:VWA domain-containing protein [Hydrogenophaga sp.]MBU7571854.1 VWA domain-containing protein [Hydrogenophaga sp.]